MGLPIEEGNIAALLSKKEVGIPTSLFGMGLLITLVGIFFGGIALNLTPCVYPLIPITASYFGCRIDESGKCQGYLVIHGFLYILGLSLMNSTLGVTAAFTGKLMGSILQHPAVLIFVSSVLLFMSLSFFGFWELRMPIFFNRILSKSYTGYFGSLFMGLTLGIVAAPCIGPFIIGLLTMVAKRGDPLFGFLIFFTLSIGLGLPLFILSMFAGKLDKLPRSGEWMLWVRNLFGWVMLAMAVYFIKPLFPLSGIRILAMAIIILASGIHLGFISKTGQNLRTFVLIKRFVGIFAVVASLFLVSSILLRGQGVSWQPYSQKVFQEAKTLGKPVIIDFYADWCAPCRNLEEKTFHNPEVVNESEKFIMAKLDLTKRDIPDAVQILGKYNVRGVPTVVFLNSEGKELKNLRIIDFMPAKDFLLRMQSALDD